MNIIRYENENVLFVSGMFAGSWIWDHVHPAINNSNINIIDEPLCYIDNNANSLCNEISNEINKMKGKVTLVGNSLGSLVSIMLAAKLPNKIKKVVISGSAGFGEVKLDLKLSRSKSASVASDIRNLVCYHKDSISDEHLEKSAECFRKQLPNITRLMRESNEILAEPFLSSVRCPVAAIWGHQDIVTPMTTAKPVLDRYQVNMHIIDQCGHSPMIDQPEKFATILNCILAT